ncbi:MAG: ABC transporter substrate-binding protein [Chthoniobacter sp.]|uniref:ABC transporter substrate-binding protein n=1 Tax=Chthoniobacter sp. TaxID=2510640 RepID=UPI0032AB062C
MRIVCLSAEAADVCARLGAWEDVVAVSAFASQAGLAPRPVIGGFSTTDCERVSALQLDLVICFSDVQADIAAQLIRCGCTVLTTNQRTLAEIADAIRLIGGAIGRASAAEELAGQYLAELAALKSSAAPRPRVYFEEWPEPLISAIGWVGELIEHCGGVDVFAGRRGQASRERVVTPEEVIAADPDIILASWCGQRVDIGALRARPGFAQIQAVQDDQIHAIPSDLLLQPGPRVLEGGRELRRLLDGWRACIPTPAHPT